MNSPGQFFVRGGLLAVLLFAGVTELPAERGDGVTEAVLTSRPGLRGKTLFAAMSPSDTGVITENNYADPRTTKEGFKDPRMWADRYREFQVGAVGTGVAIGDYDGDGKPDIFVVSKTESCRLFRNLGDWKFEDVTEKSGVADIGEAAALWKQGVTFADLNNDGWLDIYICRFNAPNLLYINQGNGTFKEEAAARGLAVTDASVMAAFCDYDRDGWLDGFIQTNLLDGLAHPQGQRNYLFHNNGDGTFTNVTQSAGITGEAQGHSAIWWDGDEDGWPDLYVANDFAEPDKLYHNNRDGTFTDTINQFVPHMPYSSMGADLGDVNNDGRIDLFVSEMAATTHQKDQRTMAASRGSAQDPSENSAIAPQYFRNSLFLATGVDRCLEAAFLTGLAATDWTWSVRFEDLDNDSRLDLFVTNGMHREVHNIDLIKRLTAAETPAERQRLEHLSPVLVEQHLAFRNLGELRFEDVSAAWGLDERGVGFGAAFGDLDGDGDLDLIYSNYKKGVTLLRNDSDRGHRVIFALRGTQSNRFGVGARVKIETESGVQVRQLVLARGVLSSSEPVLHFGLGEDLIIKRGTVEWPSGQIQVFTDLGVDRKFTVNEPAAPGTQSVLATRAAVVRQFSEVSTAANLSWWGREISLDEIAQQPLLPMRQNGRGPGVAVGDLNDDGVDDVMIGGTPLDPVRELIAGPAGFVSRDTAALAGNGPVSDGPLLLFDADGDGTIDLLQSKGGSGRLLGSPEFQPKLYLNNGKGLFRPAPADALPSLRQSVGVLAAADFDRDGRLDVFVGARVSPGQYPLSPRSALLVNRGGRFEDVTEVVAPGLSEVGMVTAALWSDVDNDGWLDLLLTVEWGNVKYFHSEQGRRFEDWTEKAGFASAGTGWWNSLSAADFNGDGRLDYVVGNLGLNTQYQADVAHPAVLFSGDFKGDGSSQLVEAYYEGESLYPWRSRGDLGASIPSVRKRFSRNDLYARTTLGEILGEDALAAASRFTATEFRSGVFMGQADGTWRFEPLPRIIQIAPLQGLVTGDFDGDGHADIYAVQNSYAPIPAVGRFDGGLSQLLHGDGHGHFTPVPPDQSGLIVPGDAKALAVLDLDEDGWPDFMVTRHNSTTLAFRNHGVQGCHSLRVGLRGTAANPTVVGARVTLELADGSTQTAEIHAGSGYYSQSSPACFFGWLESNQPKTIRVRWPSGDTSVHPVSVSSFKLVLSAP